MRLRIASAVMMMTLVACASSGTSSGGPSTVPVYAAEAEVPCRFEVVERVEAEATLTLSPSVRDDQDRERRRLLGREGARVGADAVLLPQTRNPVGNAVVAVNPNQASRFTVDFVGDAIRFLPGTCRDGR